MIDRAPRTEQLANAIVELIIRNNLPAGAPLPTEAELMLQMGVSRAAVREAMKTLQALDIVDVRHGHGTFVGSASASALQPWLLFRTRLAPGQNAHRMQDLLLVREMIELELARRVTADAPNPTLIAGLEKCLERMRGGGEDAYQADEDFHALIHQAAGVELASELVQVFWRVYRLAEGDLGKPRGSLAVNHQPIVDAIIAGDPIAVDRAIRNHFDDVRSRIDAATHKA